MSERSDLSVEWNRSPRIITVAIPSTDLNMQDLVDTLKGVLEVSWNGMDEPFMHVSEGKAVLDPTTDVGITVTLLDAKIAFAARNQSISQGTATSDDTAGKLLTDLSATFEDDLVAEGDTVINFSDLSLATVTEIVSQTQLRTYVLEDGTLNQWTTGNVYKVYHVAQCEIDGGNLVAVDDIDIETGVPMSPVSPTAFTQIVKTSSSSATLTDIDLIQFASFGNRVTLDFVHGIPGTAFPAGNLEYPSNNWTDTLAIAAARGFHDVHVHGDYTFGATDVLDGMIICGDGTSMSTFTLTPGVSTVGCTFRKASVVGVLNGEVCLEGCDLGRGVVLEGLEGCVDFCFLSGTIRLAGPTIMSFCVSNVPGMLTPIIDFVGPGTTLSMRTYSGGAEVQNMADVTNQATLEYVAGQCVVGASNTAGSLSIRGTANVIDNSAGTTIDLLSQLSKSLITDSIAEEPMADHRAPGSFFGEVATKADVAAATSTDEQPAASGSVIYGTVITGTYASTFVRDGTYWQIEEDAIDGLTAEMVFNLPSNSHRAGVFSVFGRYTGNPQTTHYMESWAYNYAANTWELLVERCMPGGNTDDATYAHEYYERHIDRDNNNEVKIRLVHHVTSYSASHYLYLDYVELSSIQVSAPIFNIGASMSDDDTTARFVLWGERESNIDMTLTGITAELFSYDGTPVADLGAGVGPDAQGCFEFSCASALLPANTALYVNVISTDGSAVYYSNAGVTRVQ